jgi:hypothetical protein
MLQYEESYRHAPDQVQVPRLFRLVGDGPRLDNENVSSRNDPSSVFSDILHVRHGRRPFHPPLRIDRLPLVFLILLILLVLLFLVFLVFLLATLAWVALFIVVVGVMVSIIPASAKSGSPPRPAPSSRKHISLSSLLSLAKPRSSLLISLPIAAQPRPSQSAPPFSFEQQPSSEVWTRGIVLMDVGCVLGVHALRRIGGHELPGVQAHRVSKT